jgi:hypothetical protein
VLAFGVGSTWERTRAYFLLLDCLLFALIRLGRGIDFERDYETCVLVKAEALVAEEAEEEERDRARG